MQQQNKYQLAYCELFNPVLCGITADSSRDIHYHYLVVHTLTAGKLTRMLCKPHDALAKYACARSEYLSHLISEKPNSKIKNYISIATQTSQYYPQIVEKVRLPGEEDVAIIKTMWLRLVQRAWKRVFNQRKHIMRKRMSNKELRLRECNGTWSSSAITLPGLQGMLQGV